MFKKILAKNQTRNLENTLRFISLLIGVVMLFSSSIVHAVPPRSIDLEYDKENKVLIVNLKHTSRYLKKHYIRKVTVKRNDEVAKAFVYHRQPKHSEFDFNLDFDANPGDSLYVIAYCNKGGVAEATLKLPEEEKPKSRLRRLIPKPLRNRDDHKPNNDKW